MIDNSLLKLFKAIEDSKEYKEYKKISDILSKDEEINKIINEIKELEKRATYLESIGDISYKDIDKEIEKKNELLNNSPIYQEYLNKMNELNDELSMSSKLIEKYIGEKV